MNPQQQTYIQKVTKRAKELSSFRVSQYSKRTFERALELTTDLTQGLIYQIKNYVNNHEFNNAQQSINNRKEQDPKEFLCLLAAHPNHGKEIKKIYNQYKAELNEAIKYFYNPPKQRQFH